MGGSLGRTFRRLLIAALAPALLSSAGCPHVYDPPEDVLTEPAAVIALVSREAGPKTAAIAARATQYSDQGVIKGKLEILLARPDSVYFAGLSPTDDVVSVLATDGERFTTFERGAKACYTGLACPENVGRLVPIALRPDQLLGVLVGAPPLIAHGVERASWDKKVGAYRLELEGQGGLVQRLWVAHGTGDVRRAQLLEQGKVTVDLTYEDWSKEGAYRLPHQLDVKMKRGDVDLRLIYRTIDVDLALEPAAFQVQCPAGTDVRVLPCDDSGSPFEEAAPPVEEVSP
ncbi:MAG: DUF4292 domain-containing protein [Deltaproteobacteria bacterium]|nr:MAG: DUF4292 domain-containing protein [Deltaproteobacteria bacterium]